MNINSYILSLNLRSTVVHKPKHSMAGVGNQEEMKAYVFAKASVILSAKVIDALREISLALPNSKLVTFDDLLRDMIKVYSDKKGLGEGFWVQDY